MMGQIRGSNIIRLYPECRPSCPSVQLALFAGDIGMTIHLNYNYN